MEIYSFIFAALALLLAALALFEYEKINITKKTRNILLIVFITLFIIGVIFGVFQYFNNKKTSIITSQSSTPSPSVTKEMIDDLIEKHDLIVLTQEVDMYLRNHMDFNAKYLINNLTKEPIFSYEDRLCTPVEVDEIILINTKTNIIYEFDTFNLLYGYTFTDIPIGTYQITINKEGYDEATYKIYLTNDNLNDSQKKWGFTHYLENTNSPNIYFKINSITDKEGNSYLNQGFMFGKENHKVSLRTDENGDIQYSIRGIPGEYVLSYEDEDRNEANYYFSPSDNEVIDIILTGVQPIDSHNYDSNRDSESASISKHDLSININKIWWYMLDNNIDYNYRHSSLLEEDVYYKENFSGIQIEVDNISLTNLDNSQEYECFGILMGSYFFTEVPTGTYKLSFNKDDYGFFTRTLYLTEDNLSYLGSDIRWRHNEYLTNPKDKFNSFNIKSIKDENGNIFKNEEFYLGMTRGSKTLNVQIKTNNNGDINLTVTGLIGEYTVKSERLKLSINLIPADNEEINIVFSDNAN